jgi:hypothetical protein
MTGPEHYQCAERLLDEYYRLKAHDEGLLHRAHVHATLALAAATALGATPHGATHEGYSAMRHYDCEAWKVVAGTED